METIETLKTIYEILESDGFEGEEENIKFKPIRCDDYSLPVFYIAISKAKGAKKKVYNQLSKVLAFVNHIKYLRFSEGCTIMPIPTTTKNNLAIWNNPTGVSRAIRFMTNIGLIYPKDKTYRFSKNRGVAKTYKYYKENEDKLLEYCRNNNIQPYVPAVDGNVGDEYLQSLVNTCKEDIPVSRVRFRHNVRIYKPENCTKEELEDYLFLCLLHNYPWLGFWMNKVEEINKHYKDNPEFRIKFKPGFKWSESEKCITSIGIRATNSLCNLDKEVRKEKIKEYGFTKKNTKDIRSSVPRITLSLNKGEWVDESKDIYEMIFREIRPKGLFTEQTRNIIKSLHMRGYFDVSDESVGSHTWKALNNKGLPSGSKLKEEDVYCSMEALRHAIIKAEGGALYDNEIFYFESVLYLSVLYDLMATSGKTVWLLYDCFYTKGFDSKMIGAPFKTLVQDLIKSNFRVWANRLVRETEFISRQEIHPTGKSAEEIVKELNNKYGKIIYRGDEWLNKNK